MTLEIRVRLDAEPLRAHLFRTVKELNGQLRSAVDRSGRFARTKTIPVMAKDMNITAKEVRAEVGKVIGSKAGGAIRAVWPVEGKDHRIRTPGAGIPGAIPRGGSIEVSTFSVSGGGSANLVLDGAFTFNANGGRVLAIRLEHGKGTHRGGSKSYRAVFAERASTSMTGDRAPLQTWEREATRALTALVIAGVQAALDNAPGMPPAGAFNSGE